MLVEQYLDEFLKLPRYAPYLIPDEQTKVERFLNSLTPRFKENIAFLDITSYTKMVHTATIAEQGIKEVVADYVNRKQSMSTGAPLPPPLPKRQSSSSGSGSFIRKNNASASHINVSLSQCNKCGSAHSGEFMNGSGVCFRCGKLGQFVRRCPMSAT
jgi:hypothetical protein